MVSVSPDLPIWADSVILEQMKHGVKQTNDDLRALRHSLAHLLAAAVVDLYPEAKPTIGPAVSNGFYYDFDLNDGAISQDDLLQIEQRMREILPSWHGFHEIPVTAEAAAQVFAHNPYKLELIAELSEQGQPLTLYYSGPADPLPTVEDILSTKASGEAVGAEHAVELCRGGHVADLAQALDPCAFTLDTVAGAYWRGDESRAMLTRIYGLAFSSSAELAAYQQQREEAKARDHRKLGADLELFTFSDLVGSGLPLFTPKGTVLRDLLARYTQQLRAKRGFEAVWIPHLAKHELYQTSGHWDKFKDELLIINSQESSDTLVLKSMNCPHHTQLYASKPRSYRDLPVKYMENTTVYRDEKSGELHGLSRVRSITQDDSHVFARPDQIEASIKELVEAAQELYAQVDMQLRFSLSFKDESDKWLGDAELWAQAQETLETIARAEKLDYSVVAGEAAFYGPKIDFIAVDALAREWQVATVQLDFVQPGRFGLEYIDEAGERQTPVMIHAALLGSFERFLSVYIEHTAGRFPFWLAPEQIRILSINDAVSSYIDKVTTELAEVVLNEPVKYNELRFTVDDRNESLGKKIREAETAKVPVILIVGPKDEMAGEVSVRTQAGETKVKLEAVADFLLEL
ncbi:MAG: threonine--tRNA ligase [Candidatus Saccharimonadales bacterium]